MSYGDVPAIREYLNQVPAGEVEDARLQRVLDRASDVVDLALGFSFAEWPVTATDQDIRARGGFWLDVPYHLYGSIASVNAVDGRGLTAEVETAVTGYLEEEDLRLYYDDGWTKGQWYRVEAKWGYGPAPASAVEVTLEIAVNFWRGADRGLFTGVIGVEGGGAVGYLRALTNQQRMILREIRNRYLGPVFA